LEHEVKMTAGQRAVAVRSNTVENHKVILNYCVQYYLPSTYVGPLQASISYYVHFALLCIFESPAHIIRYSIV
jgi:hypothetical protein